MIGILCARANVSVSAKTGRQRTSPSGDELAAVNCHVQFAKLAIETPWCWLSLSSMNAFSASHASYSALRDGGEKCESAREHRWVLAKPAARARATCHALALDHRRRLRGSLLIDELIHELVQPHPGGRGARPQGRASAGRAACASELDRQSSRASLCGSLEVLFGWGGGPRPPPKDSLAMTTPKPRPRAAATLRRRARAKMRRGLSSLDRAPRRRRRARRAQTRARSSNARDDALARQSPIARAVLSAERSTELMKARSRGVDDENRGSLKLLPPPSSSQGCRFVSRALSQVLLFASKDLRHWNRLSSVSKAWRRACGSCACRTRARAAGFRARFIDADMAMKQMLSPVSVNLAKI